ncbi:hypothetical protein L6164_020627 [Bauhinia variegata]|uniref:Uncharacterized protein n=1 Tax=Bauhinia variegata TaxID=167791 RepID=A0ACB9MVQ3_BAUVA|nr:hypothetical protein L6164_020627 [Bauhinia variegata]
MQAVLLLPLSPTFTFSHLPSNSNEFADDSRKNLRMDLKVSLKMEDENLRNEAVMEQDQIGYGEDDEDNERKEEEEFSFVSNNQYVSPSFAEDVFYNGQIRPMFPIFDPNHSFAKGYGSSLHGCSSPVPPSLKKLSIQQPDISSHSKSSVSESAKLDRIPEGSELERSMNAMVETSLERCKRSNSNGFSKLWRFRNTFRRSKGNGKDALVIRNPSTGSSGTETTKVEVKSKKTNSSDRENGVVEKVKAPKGTKLKTTPSAHEKYYVKNKTKKENNKRKSYLPYKVGFFTNVIGIWST